MNLGFFEMLTLAVLALVVFGPTRLPEVARNVGRMVATFRREANSTLSELKQSADLADLKDLRELRNELRATTAELKLTSNLSGPITSPARPKSLDPPTVTGGVPPNPLTVTGGVPPNPLTVTPDSPPPYDPDAT